MDLQTRITAGFARLVSAINAVDAKIASAGAAINDAVTAAGTTWSSTKVQAQINAAVAALIGGADVNNDTLNEIAARITANASADAGQLNFGSAQTLTAAQKTQGCANLGIGEPDTDFTTAIVSALNAGL
jgi:cell pole-organizing protein PopZ